MKSFFILIPLVLVLALLQATFLPLNLLLLLVLLVAMIKPGRVSAWLGFSSGLILDLACGTRLGLSSFLFLLFIFVLFLYRRRFDPDRPFLFLIFVFVFELLFGRVAYHYWPWWSALTLMVLTFFAKPLLKYFRRLEGGTQLKL